MLPYNYFIFTKMRSSITTAIVPKVKLLFLGILLSCSTDKNVDSELSQGDSAQEIGLKDLNSRVLVGATIAADFDNQKYISIPKKEFSAGQALFYAGFGGWPQENRLNLDNFNAVINWMVQNDISPQVHMLVGPNFYMPDWLKNGNWTNQELENHLKNLIYGVIEVNQNAQKVDVWNVINEVFNQDGTYVEDDKMVWNQLGWEDDASGLVGEDKVNDRHPVFIRRAFTYARDKTNKILEYRDYLIETSNPNSGWDKKQKAVFQLIKHMQNSAIPIDAVGIQGHHDIGNIDWVIDENGIKEAVEKFKDLGIEVHITEFDVGTGDRNWSSVLAEQQREDYYRYIKLALEAGANRVYTWGFQDGRDKGWRTNEHPLPWDENLDKKPAYFGLQKALEESKDL